jgi:hypothetical protein
LGFFGKSKNKARQTVAHHKKLYLLTADDIFAGIPCRYEFVTKNSLTLCEASLTMHLVTLPDRFNASSAGKKGGAEPDAGTAALRDHQIQLEP